MMLMMMADILATKCFGVDELGIIDWSYWRIIVAIVVVGGGGGGRWVIV